MLGFLKKLRPQPKTEDPWELRYRLLGSMLEGAQRPESANALRRLTALYVHDLVDQGGFADWQEMINAMHNAGTLPSLADEIRQWGADAEKRHGAEAAGIAVYDLLEIDVEARLSSDPLAIGCGEITSKIIAKALADYPTQDDALKG